jgi:hypothetical protein
MSTPTIKNLDKIKLLDQMLEDMAGEEFEEFDAADFGASVKHHDITEELDLIDHLH